MFTEQELTSIRPSQRQLHIQQLGFYAFIHFTVNTFTNREWGDGSEDPSVFCPEDLDARQWAEAIRYAGMKGIILTCKHHDGFCLWPTRLTSHSVSSSPWKAGQGDVVREVADACRDTGLAFGIYLSPWDRHEPLYGSGKPYNDFFVGQLTELLTGYGPIFAVWFDGACGEGPNGKRQTYDWERYYAVVRSLQPDACISVCGPDVRWCGNEAGQTRESEWSVVSSRMLDTEKIADKSQKADNAEFRLRTLSARDRDIGSREALEGESELVWYPAEVNTSIRPGWFWHESENDQVKSVDQLRDIYMRSVGGNAMFLLNIPPDRRGRLYERDVCTLREFGTWLTSAFAHNLVQEAFLSADSLPETNLAPSLGTNQTLSCCWAAPGKTPVLTLRLPDPTALGLLDIREAICDSQRIERFTVDISMDGKAWESVYAGTTIGARKLIDLQGHSACYLRLTVLASRLSPHFAFMGLYPAI